MKCLALHLIAVYPAKPLLWSPISSVHLLHQQGPFLNWPPPKPQYFLSLKGSQVSLFLKTWITTTALGWAEVSLCSGAFQLLYASALAFSLLTMFPLLRVLQVDFSLCYSSKIAIAKVAGDIYYANSINTCYPSVWLITGWSYLLKLPGFPDSSSVSCLFPFWFFQSSLFPSDALQMLVLFRCMPLVLLLSLTLSLEDFILLCGFINPLCACWLMGKLSRPPWHAVFWWFGLF